MLTHFNNAWRTVRTVWLTLGTISIVILYAQFIGLCHFDQEAHAQPAAYTKQQQAEQIVQMFGGKRR